MVRQALFFGVDAGTCASPRPSARYLRWRGGGGYGKAPLFCFGGGGGSKNDDFVPPTCGVNQVAVSSSLSRALRPARARDTCDGGGVLCTGNHVSLSLRRGGSKTDDLVPPTCGLNQLAVSVSLSRALRPARARDTCDGKGGSAPSTSSPTSTRSRSIGKVSYTPSLESFLLGSFYVYGVGNSCQGCLRSADAVTCAPPRPSARYLRWRGRGVGGLVMGVYGRESAICYCRCCHMRFSPGP